MVVADARPGALNIPFRPGNTLSVELTWPTGDLTGRTFESSLGGTALDLSVVGDVMTIDASAAITGAITTAAAWLLTETTGGASNDVLIGTWAPSDEPGTPTTQALTVAVETVEVDVTVVSGQASVVALDTRLDTAETDITALETGKVDVAGDTMTGALVVDGTVTVGDVELTGTSGSPNIFLIDGAINTFHDFAFIPATHMATDGTAPSASTAGAPRAVLAKGQQVTWAREVPAGWGQISLNILFTKEAAGSGNVHWSLDYQVVDFLTGESLAGTATTIDIGAVSVPTTALASKYYIPPGTQAILAPQQPFGIPPMIRVELTRINDGTDTYTGSIGVAAMSMSRTST